MFTDALWSTMLSIFLLLATTIFLKGMLFRYMYDATGLTGPQVFVDWRLWSLDRYFWFTISFLVSIAFVLNATSFCIERRCDRRAIAKAREHRARLHKAKASDFSVDP